MKLEPKNIIPYAGLAAGLFIIYKLFIEKSKTEKAQEAGAEDINAYVQAATTAQSPTKSRGEWAVISDQIYDSLKYSRVSDDHGNAVYQLARVKNDADVALLISTFGQRQEYFFGIPVGDEMNLPTFVTSNLNSSEIATVNDNYRRKNIKFRY
jgi:hypothetical protein